MILSQIPVAACNANARAEERQLMLHTRVAHGSQRAGSTSRTATFMVVRSTASRNTARRASERTGSRWALKEIAEC